MGKYYQINSFGVSKKEKAHTSRLDRSHTTLYHALFYVLKHTLDAVF